MQKSTLQRTMRWLLWVLALLLLVWTLRRIPFAEVWLSLGKLRIQEILVLLAVNVLVVLSLSGRWWWILRSMDAKVAYSLLSVYRLSAFSLSYFTPGPQFGGEPLQVYLLQKRHAISGTTAAATVTLDKSIELLGNFSFLIFGILIGLQVQFFPGRSGWPLLAVAVTLLIIPLILLVLVWNGRLPLTWVLQRSPVWIRHRFPVFTRLIDAIETTEHQISTFCCDRPQGLIGAMTFSLLTWVLLLVEYWLMSRYLGIELDIRQTIAILTAARIAFLTPLPGGLGALEAGQVLALNALGFSPGQGFSLGLLIRARDIAFGGLGLFFIFFFRREVFDERPQQSSL